MTSDIPRLRIVYRSCGVDNGKQRPAYYSKELALASVLRSVAAMDPAPTLSFVNDGEIPATRLSVMEGHGEVTSVRGGSNRTSYRAMIAREAARAGSGDELLWFAEDDYLYHPDSLPSLVAAAAAIPHADYFAMYGWKCLDTSTSRLRPTQRSQPGAAADPHAVVVGGRTWFRAMKTTSTFGVRRAALRQDAGLLRSVPFTGGAWDTTTCLTLQGYLPFTGRELLADLLPGRAVPATGWPRAITRGISRVGICAAALRPSSRRRQFYGVDPGLVLHMDMSGSTHGPEVFQSWGAVATDTASWAADRGMAVGV
jgi:hypothetical protein